MTIRKLPRRIAICFALGILLIVLPLFLKAMFNISDIINGTIIGVGIGLQAIGLLFLRRMQDNQNHRSV